MIHDKNVAVRCQYQCICQYGNMASDNLIKMQHNVNCKCT